MENNFGKQSLASRVGVSATNRFQRIGHSLETAFGFPKGMITPEIISDAPTGFLERWRNLTGDQASILRGRRYNRTKKQGARNDLTCGQNVHKLTTAETLAKQHGVTERTIRRDDRARTQTVLRGTGEGEAGSERQRVW